MMAMMSFVGDTWRQVNAANNLDAAAEAAYMEDGFEEEDEDLWGGTDFGEGNSNQVNNTVQLFVTFKYLKLYKHYAY